MDNSTLLYNAIQRIYRNGIVELVRRRYTEVFIGKGPAEVAAIFSKKLPGSDKTYWESIKAAANERRSGGTGELSTPIRDDFEYLGVEHFFNLFEKHFEVLCPKHAGKSKADASQSKQALLGWVKQIKNVRDPVSHPVTDDIDYEDANHVLYCARKVLDFCELPDPARQILNSQAKLNGGFSGKTARILAVLPPSDEVVMDFVGRNSELALLSEWLSANESSRWALSGEGGKGKSAIAYSFARSVAARDDHGLDAVLWMSAKRRRFMEGQTILVDRPDFHNRSSAAEAIVRAFGETSLVDAEDNEEFALELLSDFPSLVVVDDIDTVDGEGESAIEFLVMALPERSKSRVLITSRRAVFGMANVTTQIAGLSSEDAETFLRSRCDLMGIPIEPIWDSLDRILQVTDSTPLYIEDLFRLIQSGLEVDKALGLWSEKRGLEARRYAIQREYDQLDGNSKTVLLALSLQAPCRPDDLCRGLGWNEDKLADALQQLRKMFLVPRQTIKDGKTLLALNSNTRALVLEVFKDSEAFRRTDRMMRAAAGELKSTRAENAKIDAALRKVRLMVNRTEAESLLNDLIEEYPGRADCYATMAWVFKKKGDTAAARMHFRRAHELGCKDLHAYWHWAEMEADEGEWHASADAARKGLDRFPNEQGLLYRHGYALHRHGKELDFDGDPQAGKRLCEKAQAVLKEALAKRNAEDINPALRSQIYRAIVHNLAVLDDGQQVARYFAEWESQCPGAPNRTKDLDKLRQQFPQYLRKH